MNFIDPDKDVLKNTIIKLRDSNRIYSIAEHIPLTLRKDHFPMPLNNPEKTSKYFFTKLQDGSIKNINEQDSRGWGYLHYAAARNNTEIIQKLIDIGAKIDLLNEDLETPISLAIHLENIEATKLLLKYKADLNCYDKTGIHILRRAEITKNKELCELLNLENRKKITDIYKEINIRAYIRQRIR